MLDEKMTSQKINNLKMIRRPVVESMTGLSRSSLYAMMANGTFPKAIKLSERSVAWLESEVQAFLEGRIAASRAGVM